MSLCPIVDLVLFGPSLRSFENKDFTGAGGFR